MTINQSKNQNQQDFHRVRSLEKFRTQPAGSLVSKQSQTTNTMNKLEKMAKWITEHESQLKYLYKSFQKDTKDKKTPFIQFCGYMYNQCKH